jgi:exonuclease SbcC
MIPLKLTLRNFMCYGEGVQPLSFESFHTACLSGENGHGKSALLDAITWVLWGESRARDDDDLIHQGQSEMEVDFEFAADGQRYRIVRKHAKGGPRRPGQTLLELQIATTEGFRSITGDSLRQTQQKLFDLLHIDYQTFINSSFLLQGRANEFSLKQPAQRKEVLSNILGLSIYDEVGERARETVRLRQGEGENLERAIAEIDLELGKREEYEEELDKAKGRVQQQEGSVRAREADVQKLRAERDGLESKRAALLETEGRVQNARREMARWQAQMEEHHSKVEAWEKLLAGRETIDQGYARFLTARKATEEWYERLQQYTGLKEQVAILEREIGQARTEVVTGLGIARSEVQQRATRAAQLPLLERQLVEVQTQVANLAQAEEEQRQKSLKAQEFLVQLRTLRSEGIQMERDIKTIQEKITLLLQGEVRCPLCETELGVDGLQRLEGKYRDELLAKSEAQRTNQAEQQGMAAQQQVLASEVSQLEEVTRQEGVARQQAALLEKEIQEAREASQELAEGKRRLEKLERVLKDRDFAHVQQQAEKDLERQLERLGYDEEKHREAQRLLKSYEEYEAARRQLDEADKLVPQEKKALAVAEEEVARLKGNIESDSARMQSLSAEISLLPQVEERLREAARDYGKLANELAEERRGLGALEEKLRHCMESADTKMEKERLLREVREEEAIYRELSEAFGKKGIPALLIEMAVPEIEEEANRLLGLMSDNRFSLKIDTQRETKTGRGVVETLDIKVADELGTRSYEMFSGGEAFRIDLALRLSLSKLLAHRAGAPLRTLVIDEGFGTQDASGREKLVEAINSIEDEFDKIIVVTHIEELRDAFPVRLDVIKTGEGSMITVS